jgi:iron complex transport system ATP-binding protein
MLHVADLTAQILKNVSFTLRGGGNLTILGNNGSGKTTLARALCHLIPSESVFWEGKNMGEIAPNLRSQVINYVPTTLDIYDEYLSVGDYLNLNCFDGGDPRMREEILGVLEIDHLKHSPCQSLSSGESSLLLIAGAILHRAAYTILDEPTANLDQAKKVKIYRLLKNGSYFHNTIIITHDLNLAYKLGYDVLYLEEGRVRFFGSCGDFFDPSRLEGCFGNAVHNVGGNFVVNYDEVR